MFKMKKLNQHGEMSLLLIPLSLAILFFITALVFAIVFYNKYVQQRDHNQPLISAAVQEATGAQKTQLQKQFTEQEKQPYKTYTSPTELGSIQLTYPKTWSSYVSNDQSGGIDYYAYPNYVPANNVNYALRMSVESKQFADEMKQYNQKIKKGELVASAVNVAGTTGTRLDGALTKDMTVSMVIFPLRDKTLRVWTESQDYRSDFDNIVLKNLTFVP